MTRIVVIIPVYNADKYIERCILSVFNQTLVDSIQIILVDDGSIDESGIICDKIQQANDNVAVIHKENGGAASARNAGLDFAFANYKFDYIGFLDCDDVIHPQMYEKLVGLIEDNDADVASCKYKFISENETVDFIPIDDTAINEVMCGQEALENFLSVCRSVSIISPCMRLCKSHIFKDLRFLSGYIEEDSMLLPYLLEKAKKWVRTDAVMYFWTERSGSVTRSGFNSKDFDFIMVSYVRMQFFGARRLKKMKKYFSKEFMDRCVYYHCNAKVYNIEPQFSKYRDLYNKNWLRNYFKSGFCFNEYIVHFCFRFHISYGEKLYKKLNPDWEYRR